MKQGKPDEARPYFTELLRRQKWAAEQPGTLINNLNNYAWILMHCELEDLRDPQAALPFAKRAVERAAGKNPFFFDTLARAYFMTGDAAKAVETQEKALSRLSPEEVSMRTRFEAGLAKYRAALSEQESAKPKKPDAKKNSTFRHNTIPESL